MELKSPHYPFGLKLLPEFFFSFSQSNKYRERLLYLEDTEVSELGGHATMMPVTASCLQWNRESLVSWNVTAVTSATLLRSESKSSGFHANEHYYCKVSPVFIKVKMGIRSRFQFAW